MTITNILVGIYVTLAHVMKEHGKNFRPWNVKKALEAMHVQNVEVHSGATQICLVPKYEDYVIKLPYYDEELTFDPCKNSIIFYNKAKEFGVTDILLEVKKYHNKMSGNEFIETYRQPKFKVSHDDYECDRANETESDNFWKRYDEDEEFSKKLVDLKWEFYDGKVPLMWLYKAVQWYGWEFMENVAEWTNENGVNDLHSANVGYMENGQPIIIDYAGYWH